MKIKLYKNLYENIEEEDLKEIILDIKGTAIRYILLPETLEDVSNGIFEDSKRRYSYQWDNFYYYIFPHLKLNTKIRIEKSGVVIQEEGEDSSSIGGLEGYCYLNFFQKFIISWFFKKTWLQQPENIKWLLSIPLSILTAYLTTRLTK